MGIFGNNFTFWKSSADQRREQEEYRKWAFPYGDKQQENLKVLLADVFSDKDSFVMFTFLTCKEMFEKAAPDYDSDDAAIVALVNSKQKSRMQIIKQLERGDWYKYLAVVLADRNVGEDCVYPSVEEIVESARKISEVVV